MNLDNDFAEDALTAEDIQDAYEEGFVAGLYQAQELILAQIEFHTATRQ